MRHYLNLSISILDTVDTTTGQVLTPAPGARVVTMKDSHIIWQVFAEMIWNISFLKVWEELKNYEFPLKKMGIKQFLIHFSLALVLFFMSNFDVYSDINVAHDYIAGAIYVYVLDNDTKLSDIIKMNCTVSYETVHVNEFYGIPGVKCFVKDPTFGYITLAIVFAPGTQYDTNCYIT